MYNLIDSNEKLTKLGIDITNFSSLPINRSLFLLYSFQLHCGREAAIIVAMIEVLKGRLSNLFYKADTICEAQPSKQSSKQFVQKVAQKKGDHLTFLHVYQEFREAPDQKAWAKKFGIRLESLNIVTKIYNQYFSKLVTLSRAPQLSRVENVDVKKRIVEALIRSHQHLIAKNLHPIITKKDIEGEINKDSVIYQHYKKKDLTNKKFLYDELVSVNGNWEFSVVTFI
jgi:pre-mRNA-splicing factor ATP-dependent RNA helicase DHX15/PRP43